MIVRFTLYKYRKGKFVAQSYYDIAYGLVKPPTGPAANSKPKDCRLELSKFFKWWNEYKPARAVDISVLFDTVPAPPQKKIRTGLANSGTPIRTPYGNFRSTANASAELHYAVSYIRKMVATKPQEWYYITRDEFVAAPPLPQPKRIPADSLAKPTKKYNRRVRDPSGVEYCNVKTLAAVLSSKGIPNALNYVYRQIRTHNSGYSWVE